MRVLFDVYLRAACDLIDTGNRPAPLAHNSKLETYFPGILPHRRAEAEEWLYNYLKLVIRIFENRKELKEQTGSVNASDVYGTPDRLEE